MRNAPLFSLGTVILIASLVYLITHWNSCPLGHVHSHLGSDVTVVQIECGETEDTAALPAALQQTVKSWNEAHKALLEVPADPASMSEFEAAIKSHPATSRAKEFPEWANSTRELKALLETTESERDKDGITERLESLKKMSDAILSELIQATIQANMACLRREALEQCIKAPNDTAWLSYPLNEIPVWSGSSTVVMKPVQTCETCKYNGQDGERCMKERNIGYMDLSPEEALTIVRMIDELVNLNATSAAITPQEMADRINAMNPKVDQALKEQITSLQKDMGTRNVQASMLAPLRGEEELKRCIVQYLYNQHPDLVLECLWDDLSQCDLRVFREQVSTYRLKICSFLWLGGYCFFWEILFWSLLGLMCNFMYNASENLKAGTWSNAEVPIYLGKLIYTPIVSLILYLIAMTYSNSDGLFQQGEAYALVILSFVLGYFSRRSIELLESLKDFFFSSISSEVREALNQDQQADQATTAKAADQNKEAWVERFGVLDVLSARETQATGTVLDYLAFLVPAGTSPAPSIPRNIPVILENKRYLIPAKRVEAERADAPQMQAVLDTAQKTKWMKRHGLEAMSVDTAVSPAKFVCTPLAPVPAEAHPLPKHFGFATEGGFRFAE